MRTELEDLDVCELLPQPNEELVVDRVMGDRQSIGIDECGSLAIRQLRGSLGRLELTHELLGEAVLDSVRPA